MLTKPTHRICLWSGPRNVSTALMYAFGNRPDTIAIDEPLYGHYLTVSDAVHPGADEIRASMPCQAETVIHNMTKTPFASDLVFFKSMTHHLVDIRWDFLRELTNVLLIRDPVEMLPSLAQVLENPIQRDTGYQIQVQLYDTLRRYQQTPPILDSRELLLDPPGVLTRLCQQIGIPFSPAMLTWPAGPKPEDGVWARFWYHSLHQSTGFQPYQPKTRPFPEKLRPLLEECQPYYDQLYHHAIKAEQAAI